jgi:hypothetical protein
MFDFADIRAIFQPIFPSRNPFLMKYIDINRPKPLIIGFTKLALFPFENSF